MTRNLSVLGLQLGGRPWRPDMHRAALAEILELAAGGHLRPVIDRTFPMAEVARAHVHVAARCSTGKLLLVP